MSPPKTNQIEHLASAPLFFRAGVPKAVLIALATFSALLTGYSYWFVQPGIQQHYRAVCDRNLQMVGSQTLVPKTIQQPAQQQPEFHDGHLENDDRIRLLEEALLCLRRLVNWDSANDALRFETAIVSAQLADCFYSKALTTPSQSEGLDAWNETVSRSRLERQRALAAMRVALKLDGPLAPQALLWISQRQLEDNPVLPLADLVELEEKVRGLLSQRQVEESAKSTLARILVERALRPSSDLSPNARLELLREASDFLGRDSSSDISLAALNAETLFAINPVASQELAWRATQSLWKDGKSEALPAETVHAAFECLVLGGSLKEGQAFLASRLPTVVSFEQSELRRRTALTCLKMVVASRLQKEQSKNSNRSFDILLIGIAIQLDPDSSDLLHLLDSVSALQFEENFFEAISNDIMQGSDVGLKSMVSAFAGVRANPPRLAFDSMSDAIKSMPSNCIVASRLAMHMASRDPSLVNPLTALLKAINQRAPEILAVWSDRARLHLQQKQFEEAIVCLEYLSKKLPENVEIQAALESAKKQVGQ